MIQTKLLLLEYALFKEKDLDIKRLGAVRGIKELLMQIDFNAEEVPLENLKKLNDLLESIKGNSLTSAELKLTEELIKE